MVYSENNKVCQIYQIYHLMAWYAFGSLFKLFVSKSFKVFLHAL